MGGVEIIILAGLVAIIVSMERIRSPVARCGKCGYDLTGLDCGSICPECGAGPEHRASETVSRRLNPARLGAGLLGAALPFAATPALLAALWYGYTVAGPWDHAVAREQIAQDLGSDTWWRVFMVFAWAGLALAILARWRPLREILALGAGAIAGGALPVALLIVQAEGREPIWSVARTPLWLAAAPGVATGALLTAAALRLRCCLRRSRAPSRSDSEGA